jgi:hypothetical protein
MRQIVSQLIPVLFTEPADDMLSDTARIMGTVLNIAFMSGFPAHVASGDTWLEKYGS